MYQHIRCGIAYVNVLSLGYFCQRLMAFPVSDNTVRHIYWNIKTGIYFQLFTCTCVIGVLCVHAYT